MQDIIDRANLGRATLYAHYRSKEDLLRSGVKEFAHSVIWHVENTPKDEEKDRNYHILSTTSLFRHTQEQYSLYRAMVGEQDIDLVVRAIHNHLSGHIQEQIE